MTMQNQVRSFSIMPRIHFKKVSDNDYVFGVTRPTITEFRFHGIFFGKKVAIFKTSNYGDLYCELHTLDRIISRYKANTLDHSILEKGLLRKN